MCFRDEPEPGPREKRCSEAQRDAVRWDEREMLPLGSGWVQGSDPSKGCPGAIRRTRAPGGFVLCPRLGAGYASVWEFVTLRGVLAVILHALSPLSCDNLMSRLLASCFQGSLTARQWRHARCLWDAGLAEEAKRLGAFGDVGCRAAGDGKRVGPCTTGVDCGFPSRLAYPLRRPASPFWVLEKGFGSRSPPKNPQHPVLLAS